MSHDELTAQRLDIYTTESAKHDGKPLFEWLIARAMARGLAGATAYKGFAGFGRHHTLHHTHLLYLSDNLPVVVEVIDSEEKIEALLAEVGPALAGVTFTRQEVRLHRPKG